MQSERSRTRRTLYTETDTLVKSNVMDFSTSSSNTKTQNNTEGLVKKKATHIQRKNRESSNTEEKQLLELMS